ncbi:MAG: cytosine permease [Gammaproteobacteria bacterium]|nr:cytosine permease [Gammaproteobacteria bacterium]
MDFSKSQVPASATYTGWHIAFVIVGGTIAVPAFLMAANLGASLGLRDAAIAFSCGCFILGSMAALTGLCGQKSGLSAYMLNEFAFGRWGGRIASTVVSMTLIGWFGVTSALFGRAANLMGRSVFGIDWPVELYMILGGGLIVAVTVTGFKGIDKLALALVPVMLAFLMMAAWMSLPQLEQWTEPTGGTSMTLTTAISAIVGSYIAGVTIQPDYARFARSRRAALGSAFVALAISFPILLFCTAIPSIAYNEPDLLNVMIALGIGIPAFLLLILAAWSSNVLSVYSGALALALATVFRRLDLRVLIVGVGALGTLLALAGAGDYLIEYLVLLGITIPPISSIYLVDTLLFRKRFDEVELSKRPRLALKALGTWIAAVSVGACSHFGLFTLTTVAALDSIVVAAVLSVILGGGFRRAGVLVRST